MSRRQQQQPQHTSSTICYQCKKEVSEGKEVVHDQRCECEDGSWTRYIHDTCLAASMIQICTVNDKHVLDANECAFCGEQRHFSRTGRGVSVLELVLHQVTFSRTFFKMNLAMVVLPFLVQLYLNGVVAFVFDLPMLVAIRYLEYRMTWRVCGRRYHPMFYRSWGHFIYYCTLLLTEMTHFIFLCIISTSGVALYRARGELLVHLVVTSAMQVLYACVFVVLTMYIYLVCMVRSMKTLMATKVPTTTYSYF